MIYLCQFIKSVVIEVSKLLSLFQFTGDVLDCILYLLDKSRLTDTARGDPVLTSRIISKMVIYSFYITLLIYSI